MARKRTELQAIKAKCLDCCNGNKDEVKLCPCEESCPLHPFRLGKDPNRKGAGNKNPDKSGLLSTKKPRLSSEKSK